MSKVTREMIAAAHDVTMRHKIVLGHELLTEIYQAMDAQREFVGLTDDDIESAMPGGIYDCLGDPWDCGVGDGDYMRSIKKDVLFVARAAIAAYEAKNGIKENGG